MHTFVPETRLSSRARAATSSVIRDLLHLVDRPDMLSLAGGLPAPELMPVDRLAAAAAVVASPRAFQYGPTEGMGELREVLGARLACRADDVIVTTGSQQGLDLLARVLVDPGDVVVVESPSYLGSLQAFRASGAKIVAVPGDGDGLRTDRLEALLTRGLRPKAVYVVSEFANPSGATLSADRRRHLVDLARRHGFVIVDDDPYGELRWAGARSAAMVDLDGGREVVAALGSASKILAPGLRIGWLRAPARLADAVVRAKQAADLHTGSFDQLVAADVLGDDRFMAAHAAAIRSAYRVRAEALVAALQGELGDVVDVRRPDGGMFVWAHRRDGGGTAEWFEPALAAGVAFVPGSAFDPDPGGSDGADGSASSPASAGMRLCFTTLEPVALSVAVHRLATTVRDHGSQGPAPGDWGPGTGCN